MTVYNIPKNIIGNIGIFNNDGTVETYTECYDNVEIWCNSMIEDIGTPLHIKINNYHGSVNLLQKIVTCQDQMFIASNSYYQNLFWDELNDI